jgi:hypothetical protein
MGSPDPLRLYLSLKSIVELLEEWVNVALNGVTNNRAYRELSDTIVSERLMSRLDEFKSGLEDLACRGGRDDLQRVIDRLVRVEETIRRLESV